MNLVTSAITMIALLATSSINASIVEQVAVKRVIVEFEGADAESFFRILPMNSVETLEFVPYLETVSMRGNARFKTKHFSTTNAGSTPISGSSEISCSQVYTYPDGAMVKTICKANFLTGSRVSSDGTIFFRGPIAGNVNISAMNANLFAEGAEENIVYDAEGARRSSMTQFLTADGSIALVCNKQFQEISWEVVGSRCGMRFFIENARL